jgi:sucrose phosphorylase
MTTRIRQLLEILYGAQNAAALGNRLEPLLQETRAALPGESKQPKPLRASDVLLITYPDQVRAPGEPPLRTLANFADQHLRDVLSGLHILPFYPASSDDGFAVKDYFAVAPEFGTWEDIARFRPHFDLMFDAVFNHLSAQSEWFQRFLRGDPDFADFFVTVEGEPDLSQVVRPRALPLLTEFHGVRGPVRVWTTFSADQVDLNYRNPAVLLAVLRALLFYAARGARFIRLDAVAFLWKEIGTPCIHLPQTHALVQLFRAVLEEVAPHVRLITETNVPHRENVAYFGDGTNEAHLVYNFALPPLVLHAIATGDARALTHWARSLPPPSETTAFLNFLASHDGIGLNPVRELLPPADIEALVARTRAHGGLISWKQNPDGSRSPYELNITWFDALSDPAADEPWETRVARHLVSHAILLALAGMPAIYFHSLFGARNDRAGAEASGIPRRIHRQKFDRATLDAALARPDSLQARVFQKLRALLQQRRSCAAFDPDAAQEVLALDSRLFAVRRESRDGSRRAFCLHNVSPETVRVQTEAGEQTLPPYAFRWVIRPAEPASR